MRDEHFGGLLTHITGGSDREGGGSGPVVVLMHGFGAPGTDLVGLWRALQVPRETRFVFPEAPLELAAFPFAARAWWQIDLSRFEQVRSEAELRARTEETPAGLESARKHVIACLDELQQSLGVDSSRIVLGGFSQGAMLACDVVLSDPRPFAGLVMLSGTLISSARWRERMPTRADLPVFQSHGTGDAILPYFAAEMLRDAWIEAGVRHEFVPFRGGHELPQPVLAGLSAFITRVLA
ncbi:MAG TPA: hypothetical protein VHM19_10035 [Polyangiales bacterium]|nr:hypothetical protein [Polyangiales bacterium]